jgi:hypothetical protein
MRLASSRSNSDPIPHYGCDNRLGGATSDPSHRATPARPRRDKDLDSRALPYLWRHGSLCHSVLTLRPNGWHERPVGLLDELEVADLRGGGLSPSLLAAAEDAVRRGAGEVLGDESTAMAWTRGASTNDAATPIPSPVRTPIAFYYFRDVRDASQPR